MGCARQKFLFDDAEIRIRIPGIAEPVTVGDLRRDDFFHYARLAQTRTRAHSKLAAMLFAQGEQLPDYPLITYREWLSSSAWIHLY